MATAADPEVPEDESAPQFADESENPQTHLESRAPLSRYVLFEGNLSNRLNRIIFKEYSGICAAYHCNKRLYLAQLSTVHPTRREAAMNDFSKYVRNVIRSIPRKDVPYYDITIRLGTFYFYSPLFRFRNYVDTRYFVDLLERKIPLTDRRFYYNPRNETHGDQHLHSAFTHMKAIDNTQQFATTLKEYEFHIQSKRHLFRMYMQSPDGQVHVCTIDPSMHYSIIDFSKEFQRTSNIDYIRDRSRSKYMNSNTYDDVFDFRVQFQYHSRISSDDENSVENELRRQFPSIPPDFVNADILRPIDTEHPDQYAVSRDLCQYVNYIRRDFGDVYYNTGNDETFRNVTVAVESSIVFYIDKSKCVCHRNMESRGLISARLDLSGIDGDNDNDIDDIAWKLWDVGFGLSTIAGQNATYQAQRSTSFYTKNDQEYYAEDVAVLKNIHQHTDLPSILGLDEKASPSKIENVYKRVQQQMDQKWDICPGGPHARDKLRQAFEQFFPS